VRRESEALQLLGERCSPLASKRLIGLLERHWGGSLIGLRLTPLRGRGFSRCFQMSQADAAGKNSIAATSDKTHAIPAT
jgi:hypothetical protein